MAVYFTNDFVRFLQELEKNNDRDWFQGQKVRYEREVKKPFERFVEEMISRVQALDRRIVLTPKDAIFRIYRDTRFSQDKSPYKTHVSAVISSGGKSNPHMDGLYIELGGKVARLYSGVYETDKAGLQAIREKMAAEPERFAGLLVQPDFVRYFGEIRGDKNKILPAEFREAAARQPLLYNKAFYYFTEWPAVRVTQEGFVEEAIQRWEAARPMNAFLLEATGGKR
ncbi:MAG: DUF2461 domain-containing protein [Saprospiraceae bacterium]|jgi:uncharacterized protein (TIGR02453 family)|nr:DUF2461 domain-containing protein [Saprospiraceae bacterium]